MRFREKMILIIMGLLILAVFLEALPTIYPEFDGRINNEIEPTLYLVQIKYFHTLWQLHKYNKSLVKLYVHRIFHSTSDISWIVFISTHHYV